MTDIVGTAGSEVLSGGAEDDNILGLAGNDTLNGGAGVDFLDGGAGNDRMAGGAGDDRYVVDSIRDIVIEAAGQGFDEISSSSVNVTLGANIENLSLFGVRDLNGTGNSSSNVLNGNDGRNRLDGAAGGDLIFGGGGNDILLGGAGADEVNGGQGDDTLEGGDGDDILRGDAGANLLKGGAGNDVLLGGDQDVMFGGVGDDRFIGAGVMRGEAGNDIYEINEAGAAVVELAGQGTDTIESVAFDIDLRDKSFANVENVLLGGNNQLDGTGSAGNNVLTGNTNDNVLDGDAGNDTLLGNGGNDTLVGGLSNDLLDGGTGIDQMSGGKGNDTYVVDDAGDIIIENPGEGIDTVVSSINMALGTALENLVLAGNANLGIGNELGNVITGNDVANNLLGEAGNDTLNGGGGGDALIGGAGNDKMSGGAGDDRYFVDSSKDVVIEATRQGIDTIVSSISLTLGANVENLSFVAGNFSGTGNTLANLMTGAAGANLLDGGAGDDTLKGGADSDTLLGGAGNDRLDGEVGNDVMKGGLSNDTYVVDGADDKVAEAAGQGTDTVLAQVSFNLATNGANVENVEVQGINGLVILGNTLNNRITGNIGDDTLDGGDGNDTLDGSAGADTLTGGAGNDVLDGGIARDRMSGGTGNDTYVVDNDDAVTEDAGEGIDLVRSSISITLGANIENLTLVGNAALGSGNELGNVITGNAGANILDGLAGNDVLNGEAGNDTLNGGGGDDRMTGGAGDDTYFVDSAKDVVFEAANSGEELVRCSVDHTLGANVEDLELIGAADLNGVGNTLSNVMTGNAGRNRIDGGAGDDFLLGGDGEDTLLGGAGDDILVGLNGDPNSKDVSKDVLIGGSGNDTFAVFDTLDVVVEGAGQGTDTIFGLIDIDLSKFANIENVQLLNAGGALTATGNALNNRLFGNDTANTLLGGAGNDTLSGGGGADKLAGGIGDDVYVLMDGDAGDSIVEDAGAGIDRIESAFQIELKLHPSVENLTLLGTADIGGLGNALKNLIIGNSGNNFINSGDDNDTLEGGGGNDLLEGGDGNDTLEGGGGNDLLEGGGGDDRMLGGIGNDNYVIDSARDIVVEAGNQGTDTVHSLIGFTLGANVENLELLGDTNLSGTGNELNNRIIGNIGDNRLAGGAGNDVIEGDGGNDTIDGGAGNDIIAGDRGADLMTGGAGADKFLYRIDALGDIALIGDDVINGFQHGVDKIELGDLLRDFGIDANDAFAGGFLKLEVSGKNTQLLFDADGGGDGFLTLATLNGVTNVTASDLLLA